MADLPNAGDRAQVIHTCECGIGRQLLGLIVEVIALGPIMAGRCVHCGTHFHEVQRADIQTGALEGAMPRAWLRRMPPLSELESIDIHDELDAERPREKVNA